MHRTQDLALARLRLVAQRWRAEAVDAPGRPARGQRAGDDVDPQPDVAATGDADDRARAIDAAESVEVDGRPGGGADEGAPRAPGLRPISDESCPPPRMWLRLVSVLCALAVIGALVASMVAWPRQRVPVLASSPVSSQTHSATPSASPADDPFAGALDVAEATPSPGRWLLVHVAGDVRHPGIVRLPPGARVNDAVDAAGGLRRGADVGATNLARLLVDGERIEVGADTPAVTGAGDAALPGGAVPPEPAPPVDLNNATLAELDALPGIGPVTAAKILAWRSSHGRFTVVDELAEISGIGPRTLAELRPLVRV